MPSVRDIHVGFVLSCDVPHFFVHGIIEPAHFGFRPFLIEQKVTFGPNLKIKMLSAISHNNSQRYLHFDNTMSNILFKNVGCVNKPLALVVRPNSRQSGSESVFLHDATVGQRAAGQQIASHGRSTQQAEHGTRRCLEEPHQAPRGRGLQPSVGQPPFLWGREQPIRLG